MKNVEVRSKINMKYYEHQNYCYWQNRNVFQPMLTQISQIASLRKHFLTTAEMFYLFQGAAILLAVLERIGTSTPRVSLLLLPKPMKLNSNYKNVIRLHSHLICPLFQLYFNSSPWNHVCSYIGILWVAVLLAHIEMLARINT